MRFIGVRRTFSTENDGQYETIGKFWEEMGAKYGTANLMGLGCGWTENSIAYVMAKKDGIIDGADFEIRLPDEWTVVTGRTENLPAIYEEIYRDGPLLYEIEEFDDAGNCRIRYCR